MQNIKSRIANTFFACFILFWTPPLLSQTSENNSARIYSESTESSESNYTYGVDFYLINVSSGSIIEYNEELIASIDLSKVEEYRLKNEHYFLRSNITNIVIDIFPRTKNTPQKFIEK